MASTAELSRYCAAYRLGSVHEAIADSGPSKAAIDERPPLMSKWTRKERRWCTFLQWAVLKSLNQATQFESDRMSATVIARNILSFVEVSPRNTFEVRSKRDREEESEVDDKVGKRSLSDAQSANDNLQPYFFVSPPYTDVVSLFVRLSSTVTLTDEELNHFFGRYGMISAKRVGSAGGPPDGEGPATTHLQHFIVTIDVNRNCMRAITELRHPEIVLIAFSKPDRNAFCIADLPSAPSRMQTLINDIIPYAPGNRDYAHVVAGLRLAQGESSYISALGKGGSTRTSTDLSSATTFVPDLVIDHLPYWATREQIKERFALHGTIRKLRLGLDDRNGSFLGTALVTMTSLQESIAASEALNGTEITEGWAMTVGVLNRSFDIVSLKTGAVICECEDHSLQLVGRNMLEQRRMWV